MAAVADLPDFDELLVELELLERRERDVSAHRGKRHDPHGLPNEVTARQAREVSAERRELHRRVDLLRAVLAPVLRSTDDSES